MYVIYSEIGNLFMFVCLLHNFPKHTYTIHNAAELWPQVYSDMAFLRL